MSIYFRKPILCFSVGLHHQVRLKSWKVPKDPVLSNFEKHNLPLPTKIDQNTIEELERLSLVDFANKRGIKRLEEAISFADRLSVVETTGVNPMISVLEDETLHLRCDEVTERNSHKKVLSTAAVTVESYFVAPPGNIPLEPKDIDRLK